MDNNLNDQAILGLTIASVEISRQILAVNTARYNLEQQTLDAINKLIDILGSGKNKQ